MKSMSTVIFGLCHEGAVGLKAAWPRGSRHTGDVEIAF